MKALIETTFSLPRQTNFYRGKVRDVYTVEDDLLIMVATDRVSAFDVVLPKGIPFKGQVLNQLASRFLDLTKPIVKNWKISTPDPNVTAGYRCQPIEVEMIVRGYITGSAWRAYEKGRRVISGVELPDGLKANQKLEYPIITPTTKAKEGHDQEISREEIIASGLVPEEVYKELERISLELFEFGTAYAAKRGLILVDTKYEFGLRNGEIYLIDEVHTPDSSRYWYAADYMERFEQGKAPGQLSKEFVRQWLISKGFMGEKDQKMPDIPDSFVQEVSKRYMELYEEITGEEFVPVESDSPEQRIENNIIEFLSQIAH